MDQLTATMKTAFFSALFVLTFAACVSRSIAEGGIHISSTSPSSAYPGETVRVYGNGATPGGAVFATLVRPANETFIVGNDTGPWIFVGLDNLTLGSTFAGESGNWEMSFLAPNVFPGYYNVRVLDNASLSSDEVTVKVLINVTSAFPLPMNITIWTSNVTSPEQGPILFLVAGTTTPSSGPPGTFVAMSGNSASGGEISVYFDDSPVAKVVGQRGSWTASFQVPNVSTGNHTIRAIDVDGRWMSVVPFIVTSPIINFSTSLLYLFGLFAAAVFLGATLFMLLAMFSTEKRNSGTTSRRTLGQT